MNIFFKYHCYFLYLLFDWFYFFLGSGAIFAVVWFVRMNSCCLVKQLSVPWRYSGYRRNVIRMRTYSWEHVKIKKNLFLPTLGFQYSKPLYEHLCKILTRKFIFDLVRGNSANSSGKIEHHSADSSISDPTSFHKFRKHNFQYFKLWSYLSFCLCKNIVIYQATKYKNCYPSRIYPPNAVSGLLHQNPAIIFDIYKEN